MITVAADNSLPLVACAKSAQSAERQLAKDVLAGSSLDQLRARLIGVKPYERDPTDQKLGTEYNIAVIAMIVPNPRSKAHKTQDKRKLKRYRWSWKVEQPSPGCTASADSPPNRNPKEKPRKSSS